ncbi:putative bifunctional diguanylate cyclase/phosphodiesterase [Anaerobacillus sp. MEB173]|uniref:putative bifunctional diguanylate cyclase/phosphodiesterase n=1 Tax=Anaerobacillus sp. MEB173 TaxID=3383345 RepID=UPI003F8F96C8
MKKEAFEQFANDKENVWKLFNQMRDGLVITDYAVRIILANPAFEEITGYDFEEMQFKNPKFLQSGKTPQSRFEDMWGTIHREGTWTGELINRRKNGEIYYSFATITHIKKVRALDSYYIGIIRDITERKKASASITHLAFHDTLTELPNRVLLEQHLNKGLEKAEKQGEKLAVLFIDLDRFKVVNDTLGHHVGDRLLQAIAKRFQMVIGEDGVVARFGGDEFVVMLPNIASKQEVADKIEELFESLRRPIQSDEREFFTTVSIGASFYPEHGRNANTLLKNADRALYRSKDEGRNNYTIFNEEMDADMLERMQLETDLRRAIELNQLEVYYQKQVDVKELGTSGVEALVRWNHPTQGLVPPGDFLSLAEETGLIVAIDNWVMKTACLQQKEWHSKGLAGLQLSVNISQKQFDHYHFVNQVEELLKTTGIDPACLSLEITENMAIKNVDQAIEKLKQLKSLGVSIALDDFGTGYSSLSQLKRFPIDCLKIDRSFIQFSDGDDDDAEIIKFIIRLAHSLGFSVICEGVETREQLRFLKEEGCDHAQGYHFSRPVTKEQFFEEEMHSCLNR